MQAEAEFAHLEKMVKATSGSALSAALSDPSASANMKATMTAGMKADQVATKNTMVAIGQAMMVNTLPSSMLLYSQTCLTGLITS